MSHDQGDIFNKRTRDVAEWGLLPRKWARLISSMLKRKAAGSYKVFPVGPRATKKTENVTDHMTECTDNVSNSVCAARNAIFPFLGKVR